MLQAVSTMLRNVMLKLTVLNSGIMLLVFIIYSAVIYLYINEKLFNQIDYSMMEAVKDFSGDNKVTFPPRQLQTGKFKQQHMDEQKRKPPPLVDLRILVVAEDVDGHMIIPEFNNKVAMEDVKMLLTNIVEGSPQSKTVNEHDYRIFSISYPADSYPIVRVGREQTIAVKKVSAITVADPEVSMLEQLLMIIMAGTIGGFFVIIWAGHYLAQRSLVPIKTSWEKQQQFVTDASHELRTPIAVIKTNTELLLHHPDHTIEEESIRIAGILKESTRMGKLVATLLTLARADSNQIEMDFCGVILSDLLHDITAQIQPIAAMKGVQIAADIDPQIEVTGDKERLHQLFVILLDNAVKYTPAKGKITITGHGHQGSVHISVEDTGIGISKEDLPFIFERFYRGDKVRSRDDGGSGLGLAIAQWIVEKHGGEIYADSVKGEGTQFHLQLPLAKKV